jgi:ABC-type uncharacterized transport system involved in gliding motility auxiliary subunit
LPAWNPITNFSPHTNNPSLYKQYSDTTKLDKINIMRIYRRIKNLPAIDQIQHRRNQKRRSAVKQRNALSDQEKEEARAKKREQMRVFRANNTQYNKRQNDIKKIKRNQVKKIEEKFGVKKGSYFYGLDEEGIKKKVRTRCFRS